MEKGPHQSKIEKLANELSDYLKVNLNCKEIKIKKEKYMPEYGIQVVFDRENLKEVTTSVFVNLEGENEDEFVIIAMTTLPIDSVKHGYGSTVIKSMCKFLKTRMSEFKFVRAVQVASAGKFWVKCGFVPLNNVTNDYELNWDKVVL